jgi:hypothetical protein
MALFRNLHPASSDSHTPRKAVKPGAKGAVACFEPVRLSAGWFAISGTPDAKRVGMEIPYRPILIGGHLFLAAWFGLALASDTSEESGYGIPVGDHPERKVAIEVSPNEQQLSSTGSY